MSASEQKETTTAANLKDEKEKPEDEITRLKDEKVKLEADIAKLKADISKMFTFPAWINRFYGRSLALLLGVVAVVFLCGLVSNILSNDIKDVSLAWVYGIKVIGSIAVLCALLWTLLALVRSDPDQRD